MSSSPFEQPALPRFDDIHADQVEAMIENLLQQNRQSIEQLLRDLPEEPTWDDLILPLEHLDMRLENFWSPIRHLNAVKSEEALREAYNACLPKLSDYYTTLSQNTDLYNAFLKLSESPALQSASLEQRKLLADALRDFRLNGVHLPDQAKSELRSMNSRLSELTAKFQDNVLDATQSWTYPLDEDFRLGGLPESAKALLAQYARERSMEGWVITLDFPSYHSILTHADDRALRQEVYEAYTTRASDQGPQAGQFNNDEWMVEILKLRSQQAQLTGFKHPAERSLATKMAENSQEVIAFIEDLAKRAYPAAQREWADMQSYAQNHLGLADLQAWDLAYVAEKIRTDRLGLSQEMLKPYFPADRVVAGLFNLVERLFSVRITQDSSVATWNTDVRFYRIHDQEGRERAGFYLDLYARQKKRGGAWMDVCRSRFVTQEHQQLPVAYMTCNSTPPVDGKPALFTHDEVVTLFHEFGHGLHHMLTRVNYPEIAGISGVEWDAVELPSQFMENWCWEKEVIDLLAVHYETGQPMPEDLFARLNGTRTFHAAMQLLRQLEFALFDMRLHSMESPVSAQEIQGVLDQVRRQIAVVHPPATNRFQNSFTHIFAGGYSAGYYSYKWAEVLSADAYSRFEEEGLFNNAVGSDYVREILEVGSSRPALESFISFRGREPKMDAFLRHSGLEVSV